MEKGFKEQKDIIRRGTEEILPPAEFDSLLKKSIETDKPLRVKQGFDPTAPDIHLGHTVCLRKLKQFQDLGHQIVLIIGDYTGMVGDPSDKSETRPRLSHEDVMANAATYETQFFKILDRDKTEIHYNGEWFKDMKFTEVTDLAAKYTVARMLERDDFKKRFKSEQPISIHEFFYPLMQGYDSVAIKSDIEIGATEQKFNLLIARKIQEEYGVKPQCVLTMPVLPGTDGTKRMSKSTGNYIGIDEPPNDIYGKTMSIPDELIYTYFELVTDSSLEKLSGIKEQLESDSVNPMELKKKLAREIVALYYGEETSLDAEKEFGNIFSKGKIPDDMPETNASEGDLIVDIMVKNNITASKGEARRLIIQGAVRINGDKISDKDQTLSNEKEQILKAGKRRFLRIIMS
ncbi:MAG: tyrosine--tRNA ligase [Candidatus Marinimicrobia bacterium]|nr:tyrosine--tRNA ligase [Candidatus Neomarinimicrobiota bacterium]